MDLPTFIEQTGDGEFARVVGCTERAAMAWRLRERIPSKRFADLIVRKFPGQLTYSDIYSVQRKVA